MTLYADDPSHRLRQALGDGLVLAWALLWARLAVLTHEQVVRLGAPGRGLEQAGSELTRRLTAAGDSADGLPLVGDRLRDALAGASGAGTYLTDAGRAQQDAVDGLALLLALLVLLLPVAVVVSRWLRRRLRWLRESATARSLAVGADGLEVLAVRALAQRPLADLAALPAGTVRAWRHGDPAATRALAALQLGSLGLAVGQAPAQERGHRP
ncbi:hypothetical protein [Motilibacter aurantiacus]|uniref:hypothetical protein n=1 Tax=Motilibacter aurantiacus TaxID=2714955 RepID=UPI00140A5737|nr:hypothetical protein [Motilibacter aurantiacus]NHC47313.1 hypothetical protein [Motilibacter aurantiacus]